MIYKYELACREAGMSEEKIKEIRKIFDDEKKRLKREREYMAIHNIGVFSPDAVQKDGEIIGYEIPDMILDIEAEFVRKMELEELRKVIQMLSDEEREFLNICFEDVKNSNRRIAKQLGIPRTTVGDRKQKLLKKIRKLYRLRDFCEV